MTSDRLIDLYSELVARGGSDESPPLCAVAAEYVRVSGASILLSPAVGSTAVFCASSAVAQELLDLEMTVGEGPCFDACRSDAIVSERDLLLPLEQRWMSYVPLALVGGTRAVFGVPVRIGAIRLGALGLCNERAGALSDAQTTDAYVVASVVAGVVLSLQAGAPPDTIAEALVSQGSFEFQVHQAAGMVAVQGAMSVGEALARLRAHAFAIGATASVLAARVVRREVVFDVLSREWCEVGKPNDNVSD